VFYRSLVLPAPHCARRHLYNDRRPYRLPYRRRYVDLLTVVDLWISLPKSHPPRLFVTLYLPSIYCADEFYSFLRTDEPDRVRCDVIVEQEGHSHLHNGT
jgi:hypothetical protein